mgnify:CR=1 FL=1
MNITAMVRDISHLLGDEGKRFCCQLESTGIPGVYRLRIGIKGSDNTACGLIQLESGSPAFTGFEVPKLLNELQQETLELERSKDHACY